MITLLKFMNGEESIICAFEAQISFALPRVSQDPRPHPAFLPFPRPPGPNFRLNFSLSCLTSLN
jgi:hypothetical protein